MKFVKKNSWEKEWAQTLRQEKQYLQKNRQKKDSPLNQTLEEHIPDTLQSTLDSAFNKAFSLIFEKGTGVIEKTYNKGKKKTAAKLRRSNANKTGDRSTLRAFKSTSSLSAAKNLTISSVEGIGLGVLGIGLPDIPLFSAMIFKSLYEIADDYGYPYKSTKEQIFLLKLIDAALSHGEALLDKNAEIDRYIGLHRWDEGTRLETALQKTAAQLSGELLYMKFLQGIPIAGAVGGAYDVVYLNRIQTYAKLKYHKRFLLDQKNTKAFYES